MPPSIITLTTDFGASDPYVGEMKGVILGINPAAQVIDVTHEVRPQDILGGAFVIGSACPYFPNGTIHMAVVDPGVGSARRAILMDTGHALFLAPDNGLLSYVLRDGGVSHQAATLFVPGRVPLPKGWRAYAITNTRYFRHPVSRTFHGRDIFAPVAAHLSLGLSPQETGEPVDSLVCLAIPKPKARGRTITGHVLHVDRFGNLVTSIPGGTVEGRDVEVEIGGRRIRGLASSYAEASGELLTIVGGHGHVEVAQRNGSAAHVLGVGVGAPISLRWA